MLNLASSSAQNMRVRCDCFACSAFTARDAHGAVSSAQSAGRWRTACCRRSSVVPVSVADVEQSVRRESGRTAATRRRGSPVVGCRADQGADTRLAGADRGPRWRPVVARDGAAAAARRRPQVHDEPVSARVRPVPHAQRTRRSAAPALLRRVDWNHSNARSAS